MEVGDILSLSKERASVTGSVPHGGVMVDGFGVGDVGSIVLRDRQLLSQDGIIIVALTVSAESSTLAAGPDIISRGFVYLRESEGLMEDAKALVRETVEKVLSREYSDRNMIKSEIRDALGSYVWKLMHRNPVILPVVMEID